jgi:hypothetical protein
MGNKFVNAVAWLDGTWKAWAEAPHFIVLVVSIPDRERRTLCLGCDHRVNDLQQRSLERGWSMSGKALVPILGLNTKSMRQKLY